MFIAGWISQLSIVDLKTIKKNIQNRDIILGLDLGKKRTGIAVSDNGKSMALPVKTIKMTKFRDVAAKIFKLIRDRRVGAVIIGLPLHMDGNEGRRAQSARQFAKNLMEYAGEHNIDCPPVGFIDERMTSQAADDAMIRDLDLSRDRREKHIDQMAATIILQSALDQLKRIKLG